MKVLFVRHGKDDDRYRGGWSGLDLIPEGRKQAEKLAEHIKNNNCYYNIKQIISSDLTRTMTTANFIAEKLGMTVQKESRLREINNGDLAGMLNETALKKYPYLFFSTLKMDEAYPNGESPEDFYLRIKNWFEDFCSSCDYADGNILVVTHAGVINIIYHLAKGIPWSNRGSVFKSSNCGIHILNSDTKMFEAENMTDFLY